MSNPAAIGMFDSGLGGLSVWLETQKLLPRESIIYYADSLNCPYGNRTEEEIYKLSAGITEFLLARGCKIIVVACNTATSAAIAKLRENYDVPFVGMEPAVKPAAALTKTGNIAVLATRGTISGKKLKETTEQFAIGVQVHTCVGEGLVELVERGKSDSKEAEDLLRQYIEPLLDKKVDQLVLGCTHYPFLSNAIRRISAEQINLIDPAPAVARRIQQLLDEFNIASDHKNPEYSFFTSGDSSLMASFLKNIRIPVADPVIKQV
jgi:glutamate racemase